MQRQEEVVVGAEVTEEDSEDVVVGSEVDVVVIIPITN